LLRLRHGKILYDFAQIEDQSQNFVKACLFLLCPNARTAEMLTEDEARRIASDIVNSKALPDDAVNNLSDKRHKEEDTTPE
jgi:hypothetical protein